MDEIDPRVLRWINGERLHFKLGPPLTELPKGKPKFPNSCVIANAFPGECMVVPHWHGGTAILGWADHGDEEIALELPEYVGQFAMQFDDGHYPQLVEAA